MGSSINFANIFTDPNFRGQTQYITNTGWYKFENSFLPFNNNLSSLTTSILNNVRVVLFDGSNFEGQEFVVENDLPQLPIGIDNKSSSMLVELKSTNHVQLFQHANYGGIQKTLYGLSYPHIRDFFPNDILSSIKVPFGTEVHLYVDDNFQGKRVIIDKDTPFIGQDINDRISSLKIFNFPIAYSDPKYVGRSEVLEFGDQYCADSQPPGKRILKIGNDSIRSFKVPYPFAVKAYQNNNFSGPFQIYYSDVENIPATISSLEVIPHV